MKSSQSLIPEMKAAKAIHFAGLKLSLALILGLFVVPAYLVAPMLFSTLESAQAGLVAGKIFHSANIANLVLFVAVIIFCFRIGVAKSTWYLVGIVMLMLLVNTFGVSTMMAMIKNEAGDISKLEKGDSIRLAFAFWHGFGSILQLVSSILTAILVMRKLCPQISPKVELNAAPVATPE